MYADQIKAVVESGGIGMQLRVFSHQVELYSTSACAWIPAHWMDIELTRIKRRTRAG